MFFNYVCMYVLYLYVLYLVSFVAQIKVEMFYYCLSLIRNRNSSVVLLLLLGVQLRRYFCSRDNGK